MYYKRLFFLCFILLFSMSLYAQTHILTTGIRHFTVKAKAPNARDYNDYVIISSFHNSLDYSFYQKYFAVHLFGAFPSFYNYASPSKALSADESLYRGRSNEAYKSTALGIGIAPSLTTKINNFEFHTSIGPSFLFHHYQFFFLNSDSININEHTNAYFVPLNTRNYGIGIEGNAIISYFFDDSWGVSAMLTGGYYQVYNALKLPKNKIVDIVDSASIDNINTGTYAFSLGIAYRH